MRYLAENRAACIIKNAEDAADAVRALETEPGLYEGYVRRAAALSCAAHDPETNRRTVCELLRRVVEARGAQT